MRSVFLYKQNYFVLAWGESVQNSLIAPNIYLDIEIKQTAMYMGLFSAQLYCNSQGAPVLQTRTRLFVFFASPVYFTYFHHISFKKLFSFETCFSLSQDIQDYV